MTVSLVVERREAKDICRLRPEMAEDRDRRVGGWMDRQTDKRKHPLPKPPTPEGGYQSQQARSRANMRANARVNQVSLGDAVAMAAAAWSEGHCGAMASVEPSVPGSTGRGRCGRKCGCGCGHAQ